MLWPHLWSLRVDVTGFRFLDAGSLGLAMTSATTGAAFILDPRGLCHCWGRLVTERSAGTSCSPILL